MKNIKTTFIICLSISIAFGIEPAFGVEYGPQFEELAPVDPPKQEIIEEKNEDAPTDVISLSNFIKEFHQSLSKDLYSLYSTVKSKIPPPTTEETSTDVKRKETPTFESDADDIVTFASNHTNGSSNSTVDKVGETKSASSNSTLINCNIDRQQNSLTVEVSNNMLSITINTL
ncbi:uncharacterized protein LOC111050199 [Nilaparvata lugens]|uniref:uncharacterized protein LOC111050199 n=1 Tax=Nilaparvata lugens TaxID=108931 RepID=UPI00193CE4A5|nr:uncharacterized protein LOC111050199 [Nilaparvata lugens]